VPPSPFLRPDGSATEPVKGVPVVLAALTDTRRVLPVQRNCWTMGVLIGLATMLVVFTACVLPLATGVASVGGGGSIGLIVTLGIFLNSALGFFVFVVGFAWTGDKTLFAYRGSEKMWMWIGLGFFLCGPIILFPLMLALSAWTAELQQGCASGQACDGCEACGECELCADMCEVCSAWCCFPG
jgi:hypothetical protein